MRSGGARLNLSLTCPAPAAECAGWVILPRLGSLTRAGRAAGAATLASLQRAGLATLSFDLQTEAEGRDPAKAFDTPLLGARLAAVTRWLNGQAEGRGRPVGYLAEGVAAAAALWAAAELRGEVAAVVSLAGRVDLAARRLPEVTAPVLLTVSRRDRLVLSANRTAHRQLNEASQLVLAPSFRYLRYWLNEPEALERRLAVEWLARHVLGRDLETEARPGLLSALAPSGRARGRAAAAATVLALLAAGLRPAARVEAASTVSLSSQKLTYTGDASAANNITVSTTVEIGGVGFLYRYVIVDSGDTISTSGLPSVCQVSADGHTLKCTYQDSNGVIFTHYITSLEINAGLGNDIINLQALATPATLTTGSGADTIHISSDAPTDAGNLDGISGAVFVNDSDTGGRLIISDAGSGAGKTYGVDLRGGVRSITLSGFNLSLSGTGLTGGIDVRTGTGADTVNILSTLAGEPLNVVGRGSDVNRIGLGNSVASIAGPVNITNPPSFTDLSLLNSADNTARTVSFGAGTITGLAPATITFSTSDVNFVSLEGGNGNDSYTLNGSMGHPRYLDAGNGGDVITVGNGAATNGGTVTGGAGWDTLSYAPWTTGVDVRLPLAIGPNIGLFAGIDNVTGGSGNDTLEGRTAAGDNNALDGGPGTDLVLSGGDYDVFLGNDNVLRHNGVGGGGAIDADPLSNVEGVSIIGTSSGQQLNAYGFGGAVTIDGGDGNDWVEGGFGNDSLMGSGGNDTLRSNRGNDTVQGGSGADTLSEFGDADFVLTNSGLVGSSADPSVFYGIGTDTHVDNFDRVELIGAWWYTHNQRFDYTQYSDGPVYVTGYDGAETVAMGTANQNDNLNMQGGTDRVEADQVSTLSLLPGLMAAHGLDTLAGVDEVVVTGTAGDDNLVALGYNGPVTMDGGGGNDTLIGSLVNDSLQGGAGNDSVYGSNGNDTVDGGAGNDLVNGESGIDTFALDAGSGNVTLAGSNVVGNGNDTLVSVENFIVTGGPSPNLIDAANFTGTLTVQSGGGGDTVIAGTGGGSLDGGTGAAADMIMVSNGSNVFLSDATLISGTANFALSHFELASLHGSDGDDTLNAGGFSGSVTLDGAGGNDLLTGGSNRDLLLGGLGDDTLTGFAAFDTLDGGAGTDRLAASGDGTYTLADDRLEGQTSSTDTLASIEQAFLTGAAGNSLFDASAFSGMTTLDGGEGNDTLLGGKNKDSVLGGGGDDQLAGNAENDTLSGGPGNDSMDGGAGADLLNGFVGNDTLQGGDDNDTLIGAEGSDWVGGGLGNDSLSQAFDVTTGGNTANDTLRGGGGNDTLEGGIGTDLLDEVGDANYQLSTTSLQGGMGNDVLSGLEAAHLTGGDSANLFNTVAFAGPVTLDGGLGNDTFLSGGQNDVLNGGDDTDQVEAAGNVNFTLTNTLLTGLGGDTLSLVERAVITGGVSANTLNAGGFTLGPVTLIGGDGNDTLIGGSQDDSLDGGAGDDALTGNAGINQIIGGAGSNRVVESGDANFSLSNSLLTGTGPNVISPTTDILSNTVAASLTGGASANLLDAAAFTGTVTLDGQLGNDTLLGGLGSDLLIGGPLAAPDAANDSDQVNASGDTSMTLSDDHLSGLGEDTLVYIERASLTGGAGANALDAGAFTRGPVTLSGLGGNDTLIGGADADSLDGGTGNDTLTGNDGNDRLLGGAAEIDEVDETVGTGAQASANFTLAGTVATSMLTGRGTDTLTNVERVQLTGDNLDNLFDASAASVPVTLSGAGGSDSLVGGGQDDSLDGGPDNDTLTGGPGDDTLSGADGIDWLIETLDADVTLTGANMTTSSVKFSYTDYLFNSSFERASLTGGASANWLDARLFNGNSTLRGLGGDDTLWGGTSADNLQGGDGNDSLLGGNGNNLLEGGLGNDSLLGGINNDSLDGGAGDDTFTGLAGNDYFTGTAGIDLLIERADTDISLTGTTMNSPLLGNDVLDGQIDRARLSGGPSGNTLDAGGFSGQTTLTGDPGLTDNSPDSLVGGGGADNVLGGPGDDTLTGNDGNDSLDGGLGTDWAKETASGLMTLTDGGLASSRGTDTHIAIERASLLGGAGSDTLDASAYTLGPVRLYGDAGNDSLIGTAQADSLYGQSNNDTLSGRLGDDVLDGGADQDVVSETADGNFSLGQTNLSALGNDSLTAVEGASLTGGAGDNAFNLNGWLGTATLAGGAGNDSATIGGTAAGETFVLAPAGVTRDGATNSNLDGIESLVVAGGPGDDTFGLDSQLQMPAEAAANDSASAAPTHVTLRGEDGDDVFNVRPLTSVALDVDGGPHAAGDTLNFDVGTALVEQQPGVLQVAGRQPVTYIAIEFLNILSALVNKLFLPLINR